MKTGLMVFAAVAAFSAAAVPQRWNVETSRLETREIEAYHGERLELEAVMLSYGKPLQLPSEGATMFWQTNGMGNAWWTRPAEVRGAYVLCADFGPADDPGVSSVNGFLGFTGSNYRAHFRLKFHASPGASPNPIDLPRKTIDFAVVTPINAPWQDRLVSGETIKTVNGESLLGPGNIVIQGGGGPVASVNGKTGVVTLTAPDVGSPYASDPEGVRPGALGSLVTVRGVVCYGADYAGSSETSEYSDRSGRSESSVTANRATFADRLGSSATGSAGLVMAGDRPTVTYGRTSRPVAFLEEATNSVVAGAARPLPPYLHEVSFDSSYPEDAAWYYAHADALAGGCSARRIGRVVERNYDWMLDDAAEFVVRVSPGANRYGSIGVATVDTNLTEAAVNSGAWSRYYKCLPGRTLDGINECGVMAEINVVATNGAPWETRGDRDINAIGGVRWVLDHATSAGEAASNLAERVYIPVSMTRRGYSCHYAICDILETWIVEDGVAERVGKGVPPVMTNFRLLSPDPNGSGYERYAILTNAANSITDAWWTKAYVPSVTPWVSDIGADTGHVWEVWASADRETHRREGKWWQSVHTSIYDIGARTLKIAVQETGDWYEFALGQSPRPLAGRTFDLSSEASRTAALQAVIEALGGTAVTPEPVVPIRERVREAIIGLDQDTATFHSVTDALMERGLLPYRPTTAMELGMMLGTPGSVTNVTAFFDYYLAPPNTAAKTNH